MVTDEMLEAAITTFETHVQMRRMYKYCMRAAIEAAELVRPNVAERNIPSAPPDLLQPSLTQTIMKVLDDEIHKSCIELGNQLANVRLQRDHLWEALHNLLSDLDEYVRINNLFDEKGRPASWQTMDLARAALKNCQS